MFGQCIWIAVIDDRRARLLRARRTRSGKGWRLRLQIEQTVENTLQELDRGAAPADEFESPMAGSRNAELTARYAVDVAKWLGDQAQRRQIEQLEVFTTTRLAALLGSMYSVALGKVASNHSFDAPHATIPELERHPELVELAEDLLGGRTKRAS